MCYDIYSEESSVIGRSAYELIRDRIAGMDSRRRNAHRSQRSIYFNQDINYLNEDAGEEEQDMDRYSINICKQDYDRMKLVKESFREGTIYRQSISVSAAQCESILSGDLDWMKESDELLFRDLYLQMTINQMWPGVIVDYEREIYRLGQDSDFIIFDTSIASSYNFQLSGLTADEIAEKDFHMEQRMEPGKVVMTCRQGVSVSRILDRVMEVNRNYRLAGN